MRITDVTFAASLNCPTKCFLCLHNEAGGNSEFSQWQARIEADFEGDARGPNRDRGREYSQA